MKIRTYSELSALNTFEERFRYLKLSGTVGVETFGFDRYLNQALYRSKEWKTVRNQVLIRDGGFDLGDKDHPLGGRQRIIIHHMNPITEKQIEDRDSWIFDPEFLITTSIATHNAIHYGDESLLESLRVIDRKPNDTCPWR